MWGWQGISGRGHDQEIKLLVSDGGPTIYLPCPNSRPSSCLLSLAFTSTSKSCHSVPKAVSFLGVSNNITCLWFGSFIICYPEWTATSQTKYLACGWIFQQVLSFAPQIKSNRRKGPILTFLSPPPPQNGIVLDMPDLHLWDESTCFAEVTVHQQVPWFNAQEESAPNIALCASILLQWGQVIALFHQTRPYSPTPRACGSCHQTIYLHDLLNPTTARQSSVLPTSSPEQLAIHKL